MANLSFNRTTSHLFLYCQYDLLFGQPVTISLIYGIPTLLSVCKLFQIYLWPQKYEYFLK